MSEDCKICSTTKSRPQNNCLVSALHTIQRYPVNTNGTVGSLYNANIDEILEKLPMEASLISTRTLNDKAVIKLRKLHESAGTNLLETIKIDGELRLNLELKLTKATEGILMLNNYEFSNDNSIRLISYYHAEEEEYLSTDAQSIRKIPLASIMNKSGDATHFITSVKKGVYFVILLELINNESQDEIDRILNEICKYFTESKANFLTEKDQKKMNRVKTAIFTQNNEIRSFEGIQDFNKICKNIRQYIFNHKPTTPISYELHSISYIYHNELNGQQMFHKLDPSILSNIEKAIVAPKNKLKSINRLFRFSVSPIISKYYNTKIKDIDEKLSEIKKMHTRFCELLSNYVIEYHRGKLQTKSFDEAINGEQAKSLNKKLEAVHDQVIKLHDKDLFIRTLETKYGIKYFSLADLKDNFTDQASIETKLKSLNPMKNVFYLLSSDTLVEKFSDNHDRFCKELCQEHKNDSSVETVFVDFSDHTFKLSNMKILKAPILVKSSSNDSTEINILLIGETGVGKSTFINAFVNYLAFHSLDDAKTREPIVLIPASFIITVGQEFEERQINFGQPDSNENHNQLGQSVTQYCQSYIFNIKNNLKIRLIDTPGIGDTRGLEQDKKNIEHILEYIGQLSHLNGICFLLNPNVTRLHISFRTCFKELFQFLGSSAYENTIFCFTNTRSTFYLPGDTAPLLKKMLREFQDNQAPLFAKENTFCFDSESFRYLAVIQTTKEMVFSEDQDKDFHESWKYSVNESIRLLKFIKARSVYHLNKFRSIRHAQSIIITLVRPILEAIRNAARNLVLRDLGNTKFIIEMYAHSVSKRASFCTDFHYKKPIYFENLTIFTNSIHQCHGLNRTAECTSIANDIFPMLYMLEYKKQIPKETAFYSEQETMKNHLIQACVLLTRFSLQTDPLFQNPFLTCLNIFIAEEGKLSSDKAMNTPNYRLHKTLVKIKEWYELNSFHTADAQNQIPLDTVYQCIDGVMQYKEVQDQMEATKRSQIKIFKNHEHDISKQYPHMNLNGLGKCFAGT